MDANDHLLEETDYLDATDSFMGLGHADRLGWIFIRQHLSAAKVVSSKDDPINKIFWLTGAWDCAEKKGHSMQNIPMCCKEFGKQ